MKLEGTEQHKITQKKKNQVHFGSYIKFSENLHFLFKMTLKDNF